MTLTMATLGSVSLSVSAAQATTRGVDLALSGITQSGRFTVSRPGTLTVRVSNAGSVASSGDVEVEMEFASRYFTLESIGGPGWSCTSSIHAYSISDCHRSDPVAAGAAVPDLTLVVTPHGDAYAPGPGGYDYVTGRLTNASDATPGNNYDSFSPIVDGAAAGISAEFPDVVDVAAPVSIPVTITNTGTRPGLGSIAVRAFDGDDAFQGSASGPGWTCNPNPRTYFISCSHSFAIDPGQSLPVLTLDLHALEKGYPDADVLLNVDDDDPTKDTYVAASAFHSFTITGVADLSVTGGLRFAQQPATVGQVEPVTVRISNIGTVASTGGTIVTFPQDSAGAYTPVSAEGNGWSCAARTSSVLCTHPGDLDAHARRSLLTAQVRVGPRAYTRPSTPGTPFTVTVDNGDGDDPKASPALYNNSASVRPTVDGVQDLALSTPHPDGTVVPVGGVLAVPLSISAVGGADVRGTTTVQARLQPGVTVVASSGAGWRCSTPSMLTTCTRTAPVEVESPASLVLSLQFDRSLVHGRPQIGFEVDNANQVDDYNESIAVTPRVRAGLNYAASFGAKSDGRVTPGRHLLFNVGVDNLGSQPGTGSTTVTYTEPSGLQIDSVTSAPNFDCAASGDTVTCTRSGPLPLDKRVVAAVIRGQIRPGTAGSTITHCVRVAHDGDIDEDNDRACADYLVGPEPAPAGSG